MHTNTHTHTRCHMLNINTSPWVPWASPPLPLSLPNNNLHRLQFFSSHYFLNILQSGFATQPNPSREPTFFPITSSLLKITNISQSLFFSLNDIWHYLYLPASWKHTVLLNSSFSDYSFSMTFNSLSSTFPVPQRFVRISRYLLPDISYLIYDFT